MGDDAKKGLGEQALDGLARLGMLGLLLAIPTAIAWAVKRALQRPSKRG